MTHAGPDGPDKLPEVRAVGFNQTQHFAKHVTNQRQNVPIRVTFNCKK